MKTEDEIISELDLTRTDLSHQFRTYNFIRREYTGLAIRANKLYSFVFTRLQRPTISGDCFIENYLDSWERYLLRASQVHYHPVLLGTRFSNGNIYATWHFPEYPSFLRCLVDSDAFVLLARDVPWIKKVIPPERLIIFRSNSVRRLAHAFQLRQPIVCMFDYCYAETRSLMSSFLGFPCKTPSGLLELLIRYNYSLKFLTSDGLTVKARPVAEHDSSSADCVQTLADSLNELIEAEILHSPCRWLLWPSIDTRWGL